MPYAPDCAASRYARDRDLPPVPARLGPYELRYDVRRGYDGPLHERSAGPSSDVLLFRAREDDGGRED